MGLPSGVNVSSYRSRGHLAKDRWWLHGFLVELETSAPVAVISCNYQAHISHGSPALPCTRPVNVTTPFGVTSCHSSDFYPVKQSDIRVDFSSKEQGKE